MADLLRAYIGRRIVAQVDVGATTDTIIGTLQRATSTELELVGATSGEHPVDGIQVLRRDHVAWVQVLP